MCHRVGITAHLTGGWGRLRVEGVGEKSGALWSDFVFISRWVKRTRPQTRVAYKADSYRWALTTAPIMVRLIIIDHCRILLLSHTNAIKTLSDQHSVHSDTAVPHRKSKAAPAYFNENKHFKGACCRPALPISGLCSIKLFLWGEDAVNRVFGVLNGKSTVIREPTESCCIKAPRGQRRL